MQKLQKEFRNEKDLFQFPEEWENDILLTDLHTNRWQVSGQKDIT